VNIRQVRNTRKLKAWLRAGKTVELRERDKVIARIVPRGTAGSSRGTAGFRSSPGEHFW